MRNRSSDPKTKTISRKAPRRGKGDRRTRSVNPSPSLLSLVSAAPEKGTFLRALEDRGYFCVDNLPVGLLSKFYELTLKSEDEATKVAMVIDVREGESLRRLPSIYDDLKKQEGLEVSLWFLEASEAALGPALQRDAAAASPESRSARQRLDCPGA